MRITWTTTHGDEVEVYEAGDGYRYRVVDPGNHEIVDQSSEAYTRWENAQEAAERHHPVDVDAP
jgi:uncharacterized protein YegP (UPF0339 family)